MSRDELVNAYIEGGVSRRTFIRRLVGAGVSLGAAVSYAHLLSPGRAGAQTAPNPDFYTAPQVQVELVSTKVAQVAKSGVIEVLAGVQEPAQFQLVAVATVPPAGLASSAKRRKRKKAKQATIASMVVDLPAAGQQLIKMPLNSAGRKLLKRASKAQILVSATVTDRQGAVTTASVRQALKRRKKRKKRR